MLIEFSVGNFQSIKDRMTLSMVATTLVSKGKTIDEENVIRVDDDFSLLKTVAIYGANASGKTNLVDAMQFMRDFVRSSSQETQAQETIRVQRFRLSTVTEDKPSFFQMVFLLDGLKYRYGFEVTPQRVTSEWLFCVPNSREAKLFERHLDDIKVYDRFKEGKGIEERTRPNALFLSVVSQFNGKTSGRLITWFRNFSINLGSADTRDLRQAANSFHQSQDKGAILRLVKDLDLGINDIRSEQESVSWADAPDEIKQFKAAIDGLASVTGQQVPNELTRIRTLHRKYDPSGNPLDEPVVFDLAIHESAGTRRLFSLALPILTALEEGHVLCIDEIDARLHPLITCTIIGLFNSRTSNPNNAQLVFTTHDTNLLSNARFRRDQIWFVEKDKFGATHLYSLAEFKVRNDASYKQDYIRGKYGAIPFIASDLGWIVGTENAEV